MKINVEPPRVDHHKSLSDRLHRLLAYDPDTGAFTRLAPPRQWCSSDAEYTRYQRQAGSDPIKRRRNGSFLRVFSIEFAAARLAWFLHTGQDPGENVIIFRDHDIHNLRFSNLACVSKTIANRWASIHRGDTGIFCRDGRRYEVRINAADSGQIFGGSFDSIEDAQKCRNRLLRDHWGCVIDRDGTVTMPLPTYIPPPA